MNKETNKIIWLASYPKSGNTWVRAFLERYLTSPNKQININQIKKSTIASSRFLIDRISGISSADLTDTEIEELRPRVYANYSEQIDNISFLKVHDAWKRTSSGLSMFPAEATKGVIYLIRNPLDIAVSFAYHSSKKIEATIRDMNNKEFAFCNDPIKRNHQVRQILSDWSGHVVSWLDESELPVLVIRYEDMLENASSSFRRVLNFLDMPIEEEKFTKAMISCEFNNLKNIEKKEGFIEKPMRMKNFFRQGKSGIWMHFLTPDQIKEIVNTHKIQMERFNYMPIK